MGLRQRNVQARNAVMNPAPGRNIGGSTRKKRIFTPFAPQNPFGKTRAKPNKSAGKQLQRRY